MTDKPDRRGIADDGDVALLRAVGARSAAQMSSENFPVALRLVPPRRRRYLERIYGYARFVDDVGDEAPGSTERRLALLDAVEQDVRALWTGRPVLPPVQDLAEFVADCAVPMQPLLDLIEANRVDQRVSRYETFADLLDYCRLSAAPVGQLVLYAAGRANARTIRQSDKVCAALQVLEHCQDVGEDARAGRVYLPATDLRTAEVSDADLLQDHTTTQLRWVVAVQVDRAWQLLRAGRDLVPQLSGWSRMAVSGYVGGGMATVDALRAADYDVLGRHVGPAKVDTAKHALRLVVGF